MKNAQTKQLIGRAEQIVFSDFDNLTLHARIDTGAKTSAVWATDIKLKNDVLTFRLCSQDKAVQSEQHQTRAYSERLVANSTGHVEKRYAVKLRVVLAGRRINATFTLANRATQVYPVLVGRNLLRGKFVVDVSQGQPLKEMERHREHTKQATHTQGGNES